uniref:Ribbon-helix-helix protein, CopG family n=1 Tax=Rhodothermus marinus TaxID=29549 RepID=A0A7V2F635_RHOMR
MDKQVKPFPIRLREDQIAALRQLSRDNRQSIAETIRIIIDEALARRGFEIKRPIPELKTAA